MVNIAFTKMKIEKTLMILLFFSHYGDFKNHKKMIVLVKPYVGYYTTV